MAAPPITTANISAPPHGKVDFHSPIEGASKQHLLARPGECGACLAQVCFPPFQWFEVAAQLAPRVREYGFIASQERIGLDGERLWIPKIATIRNEPRRLERRTTDYPINKDAAWKQSPVRVTKFGIILRRWFIDEIPQLLSLCVGDIKLVGVRPKPVATVQILSEATGHRKAYLGHKPGLINFLYALEPQEIDSPLKVGQAEVKYFKEYDKAPLLTDLKYGAKALWNIFFRGRRGV